MTLKLFRSKRRSSPASATRAGGRTTWGRSVLVSAVLSSVLLAALAGWFLAQEPDDVRPAPAPAPVASVPASRPPALPPAATASDPTPATTGVGFPYTPGDHLRFDFSVERVMEVTFTPDPSQPAEFPGGEFTQRIDGVLALRVYDATETHFEVGFEVERVRADLRAAHVGEVLSSKEIAGGMAGEVLAKLHRRGEIESLQFPETTTVDGRNHWRDVLALWQVVLPEDPELDRWEASEEDTTGQFVALYERRTEGARIEITKEKVSYSRMRDRSGADAGLSGSTVIGGGATITLDPLPLRIAGEEQLEVHPREFPQTLVSELRYSFERRLRERRADIAAAAPPAPAAYTPAAPLGATEYVDRKQAYEPLGDEGIAGLLGESRQVIASHGLQSPQLAAYLGRLVEHMKNDPRVVAAVLEKLRSRRVSEEESAVLMSALGAAGTPPAQDGLQEIFTGHDFPREDRLAAMLSFSEVEAPIADVDELLVAMHEDGSALSPSALLLMGAVGNRVRESDPERFDEIRGYVEEKIFEGSSREEQLTALEALGNLGPEATPEYVEQLIHSDDVDLRGTAVRTLRDTFDERSDWLLANTVREDPSDEVRVAAVEILAENGQRGERGAAHELLDEALRTDASEDVRKSALAGMNVVATPESRESIAWVAANDTSEELRAMATAMVESWERTGEATEDGTATE